VCSFIFGEDQRIPNRVFSALHASIVKLNAGSKEEPETVASTTTVRRMVSVLVKRSLVSDEEFSMLIYDDVCIHV
jgi:hypothetical protein